MSFISPYSSNFKKYYDEYFLLFKKTEEGLIIIEKLIPISLTIFIYWSLTTENITGCVYGNHQLKIEDDKIHVTRGTVTFLGTINLNEKYTINEQIQIITETPINRLNSDNTISLSYLENEKYFSRLYKISYKFNTNIIEKIKDEVSDVVRSISFTKRNQEGFDYYDINTSILQLNKNKNALIISLNIVITDEFTIKKFGDIIYQYLYFPKFLHINDFTLVFFGWDEMSVYVRSEDRNLTNGEKFDDLPDIRPNFKECIFDVYSYYNTLIYPRDIWEELFGESLDVLNGYKKSFRNDIKFRDWALNKYNLQNDNYDELVNLVESHIYDTMTDPSSYSKYYL